jgi:peptidoglycan/LPS O-acetylase OafA/YrhL
MVNQRVDQSHRLAWVEGIRIVAVVMLLLYHAQLRFTGYAYTPQPTGLLINLRQLVVVLERLPRSGLLPHVLSLPSWFGFQFIDVFVLISGFSLVLCTKGRPVEVGQFLRQRVLRILWPFWTVAWLTYPMLWAIAIATNNQFPSPWQLFTGITYPLVYDYSGSLLMVTTGPWWLMSLILSFILLFPFLWFLQQRWGATNFLLASLLITLLYRSISVYWFDAHPTYVLTESTAGWQPFALFLAKLGTFTMGMVTGQAYLEGTGPAFWSFQRALSVGIPVYMIGALCQFYHWGWVVADLLVPVGVALFWMAVFRTLESWQKIANLLVVLGAHTYSYFLLHGLVVDRTLDSFVQGDARRYSLSLPLMLSGTLALAMLADYTCPLLQRLVVGVVRDVDHVLSVAPALQRRVWEPQTGEEVFYRGEEGWTVVKVEKLWDEQEFFLCQVSNGRRSLWVKEEELEPTGKHSS